MSWKIDISRNHEIHNKMGLFHNVLEEKSQKNSLSIIESQKLPNFNPMCKIQIEYRSDTKKIEPIEYRGNGNQWKNNQSLQLQREEFDKLLGILPSLLGYVET